MSVAETGQSYSSHVRFFPMFHFFAFPVLGINMLVALWQVVRTPSLAAVWALIVAAALAALALAARVMAVSVQDRVIRLEMRLRLRELLPPDLQPRVMELTRQQLIGLRFASDAELPDLVRQVLSGSLKSTTEIKKAVKQWQGDYLRA